MTADGARTRSLDAGEFAARALLPLASMSDKHVVIIGGGLAGLAAGCFARRNGFSTTIVEHNLSLGGVCTAWKRGEYLVDGCIHWLTGGAFARVYAELGIVPPVKLRTLEHFSTYRHVHDRIEIPITRNLDALARDLQHLAPVDAEEIRRVVVGAREMAELDPRVDRPPELANLRQSVAYLWSIRHEIPSVIHFRKPVRQWLDEHVKDPRLARFFEHLAPPEAPALFPLMMLGYLERGFLSRPIGGTPAFRDALVANYGRLGGKALLHTTVDEILVENHRATGVRLGDGELLEADVVISTSSTPETVFRLLGGRYGAAETEKRMRTWKLFDPIVLASFGVEQPLTDVPAMLSIDGIAPFELGGHTSHSLYVRVENDDPCYAPPGHSVVQLMAPTSYEWWAKRGTEYSLAKDRVAAQALGLLEPHFPGLSAAVRMTDIATPITFWNTARSWRGAYEGWFPMDASILAHVHKTLPGLDGFYMAGQWVEPGGGIPTVVVSGRQVVQLLCADEGRPFIATST